MRTFSIIRSMFAASILVAVGLLGASSDARATLVANLGTLSIGDATADVTCSTALANCTTTIGNSSGGQLTDSTTFTHQVYFQISSDSVVLAGNLTSTTSMTINYVKLFEYSSGNTTQGGVNATGINEIVGAILGGGPCSGICVWQIVETLDSTKSYFVEIQGTPGSGGAFTQQVTISAIPLPPALILLATALFGLIGVGRIRRRRAMIAA